MCLQRKAGEEERGAAVAESVRKKLKTGREKKLDREQLEQNSPEDSLTTSAESADRLYATPVSVFSSCVILFQLIFSIAFVP